MYNKLSDLIFQQAGLKPEKQAVVYKDESLNYGVFGDLVSKFAQSLLALGLRKNDRVANYMPKQFEAVISIFGPSHAGGIFVPINPVLKAAQVAYILKDCDVRFLLTSSGSFGALKSSLAECLDLEVIVLVGAFPEDAEDLAREIGKKIISYNDFMSWGDTCSLPVHDVIDADIASIFYTSGSTGMPKGVVLSHRNMIVGAESVSSYLENTSDDRILSVIPLSFDVGLNQLTTAFLLGATAVLMNYLLPRDVIRQAVKYKITGITCVPPLWIQLVDLEWPEEAVKSIRYIATTGGRMPVPVTRKFQKVLPKSDIYLMYGLTEAFRSTYLPPSEVDRIPNSIGKAIPNAEIMVVREDGTICDVNEPGELVHRGALVGLGYWNNPERTNERYRPAPGQVAGLPNPEIAVWSGDTVKKDEDGYLYFVGRRDEMIKTAGYRVSPTELEETIYSSGLMQEICAIAIEDNKLGHVIWIVLSPKDGIGLDEGKIAAFCRRELPSYMVPQRIIEWATLPKNANGKVDRKAILATFKNEEDA